MKKTKYIYIVILIALFSCNKSAELDQNALEVLIKTNRDMREGNLALLNKTEVTINEKGNRPLDIEMLENVKAALTLRGSYELEFSLDDLGNKKVTLPINDEELSDFTAAFSDKFEQLNEGKNNGLKTDELKQLSQTYLEDKTMLNLLVLDLHILNLERDLVGSVAMAVGDTETFGFDGKLYDFLQTEEPKLNEPLNMMISVGHDYIGADIKLSEPVILINGEKKLPYELTSFNKGLWLLTFTPEKVGTYTIDFSTTFKPELYPSEQYTFSGKFEVRVE